MKVFRKIPERGDFGYQQLVAPYKVTGEALHDIRGFNGLVLSKTIPCCTARDADGHLYSFVRSVMAPTGTPNPTKFVFQSTRLDGQHLRIDKERVAQQASTDMPVRRLDGDTCRWSSQPTDRGNPWALSASGEGVHWLEQGLADIRGTLVGNGLQWYLPGVDWGTFYIQQFYAIDGEILSRPVRGMMSLDQAYLAEGGAIHYKKDLVVNNKMHVIWWAFATMYKDGSYDVGSFMVGHDNLGFAILMNETGEARVTTDIEGQVRHKPGSYFAESARVVLDGGEEWEFLPDPKGEMVDFVGGFPITAQQEGRWRRVGDRREPDRWYAWGETDRRNGSARNVFGADL
jgi:hypothetical protein